MDAFICRECIDPFDDPECEAFDVFVNEVLCVGKGKIANFNNACSISLVIT